MYMSLACMCARSAVFFFLVPCSLKYLVCVLTKKKKNTTKKKKKRRGKATKRREKKEKPTDTRACKTREHTRRNT